MPSFLCTSLLSPYGFSAISGKVSHALIILVSVCDHHNNSGGAQTDMLVSFFATNTLRTNNRIIAGDDLYIADLIDSHDLIAHYRDAPPHAGLLRLRACGLLLLYSILSQYNSHSSHNLPFKFSSWLRSADTTQLIHCNL